MFEGMFVTSVLKCRQLWCVVTLVELVLRCWLLKEDNQCRLLPSPTSRGGHPRLFPAAAPRLYPLCLTQKKERLPLSPDGLTSGGKMLGPSVEDHPPQSH